MRSFHLEQKDKLETGKLFHAHSFIPHFILKTGFRRSFSFNMLKPDYITSLLPTNIEQIILAYSGGVDSHVLLHLIASNPDLKSKIIAVYIHHGLQVEADGWGEHCQLVALNLGVRFKIIKVIIDDVSGKSIEELARDARYQALKPLLEAEGVLLLAQHREDQLETVLLQLFRGAGVQGLSGMPVEIPFGKGRMCRPLLDVSKQDIYDYAISNKLSWVEDPSNKSNDFDRNFLRNEIVPKLKQKWPALDKTVARSARHCANAHQLSEDVSKDFLSQIINKADHTLNIAKLIEHDSYMQSLGIRQWFKFNQLRMPAESVIHCILNELIKATESRNPELKGEGYRIRRYRDKLFCLKGKELEQQLVAINQQWKSGLKQITLGNGAMLTIVDSEQGLSKRKWEIAEVSVRFRQGAEKIRLVGREGRHTLKKLYQEKGIPPWERNTIPLIYLDNQLAAIANLWVSADFCNNHEEPGYSIDYYPRS